MPVNAQWSWEKAKSMAHKAKEKAVSAYSKSKYTVPVTQRTFIDVIPDDIMLSLSTRQYRQVLRCTPSSRQSDQVARVNRVASRLQKAVERLYEMEDRADELENFSWEYHLVRNSEANASCAYGGKILVYDGILPYANDDASLAIVLGHEIGHAIAKHSAEQLTKRIASAGSMAVILSAISNSDMSYRKKVVYQVMASVGATLANLKFSRLNESEADRLGLILAAMAGYDPGAAVGFWQRMQAKSTLKTVHDWFSTHPSNANRIQNIKALLPEARSYQGK